MRYWVMPCFALAVLCANGPAAAQAGSAGTLSSYHPREGEGDAFEKGYVRHLRWHLANGDRLAWYMWRVARGDRTGMLIGGTLGNAWPDLDQRVKPAEDGADHRDNVDHYETGEPSWGRYVELRKDLGGELSPLERAPYLSVYSIMLRPDARATFEQAVRALAQNRGGTGGSFGWLEVVAGGTLPAYILVVPAQSIADAADDRWDRLGLPASISQAAGSRDHLTRALTAVESVHHELWRFLPDLSTCRHAASRCVGVVPSGAR